ncbi:MAG: hypothetical protein CBB71_06920 [Rhodopirellula sp. TMED11]|nr:MAG: hypothetical protein CBB71_06920 [Rhodopirellula sp. TMED11]
MSDTPRADSFTFAMGDYDATFPCDRLYVKNHMWARPAEPDQAWHDMLSDQQPLQSPTTLRFGLTQYAVRLLQDVYFLDWELDCPSTIKQRQMIGSIESKKAESDLYAPAAGTLTQINQAVLDNPSLINADTYQAGWLFAMELTAEAVAGLLAPESYRELLDQAWVVAQRAIKGQANL